MKSAYLFGARFLALAALLATLVLFPLNSSANKSPGFDTGLDAELGWKLCRGVLEYGMPGAVMGVWDPDGEVSFHQAGEANLATGQSMNRDLYFQIGSLTKTFTATAMLMLVDQGLVELDDTVDGWYPGMVTKGGEITVTNLLQMRSGLEHYEDDPAMIAQMTGEPHYQFSPEELVAYADGTAFEPDTAFDYNNVNYIILGMILEKATGQTYHEVIQDMILDPLHLTHTMVPEPQADPVMPDPHAHGYLTEDGAAVDYSTYFTRSWAWSAGNMVSTLGDMLMWCEFVNDGALLSAEMKAERFDFLPTGRSDGLGYGMGITEVYGAVGHSGNYDFIYTAGAYEYEGYRIAVLANGQNAGGGAESMAKNIVADVFPIIDKYK